MSQPSAVFFISFGGPEKSADIMPFLETVTQGRGIPRARLEDVAHHYEKIGGASPINAITAAQAEGLSTLLQKSGLSLPVYVGNRNWHPFIEDTLRRMKCDGIQHAVGFITAAHRTEASLERYVRAVEAARDRIGPDAPVIDYVGHWFDHPLFIEAISERIEEVFKKNALTVDEQRNQNVAWIFTAHSIPCAMAKDSTYVPELRRTAFLVCERFGQKQGSLAYSSRSGKPEDAWLEPDICDAIREKAQSGVKKILAIPIGFVADHVEVLFDLDVEAQEAADEAGVQLLRAQTVGTHPTFIRMIETVIRDRLHLDPGPLAISSISTRYRDGQVEEKIGRDTAHCYCRTNLSDAPCLRVTSSSAVRGWP